MRLCGYAARGRRLRVARQGGVNGPAYSITLMTSLTAPNGFVLSARKGSNNAFDFLHVICDLIADGHLVAGDVLVLDNASIHYAAEIQLPLDLLLAAAGVRLLFLPTYSPELSPCEFVFGLLKNFIRRHRSSRPLLSDIILACSTVSVANVFAFYDHCIHRFHE